MALGDVSIEPVAHVSGWREVACPLVEQLGKVLACMVASREVERDLAVVGTRDDDRGEQTGAIGGRELTSLKLRGSSFPHELEYPHRGVITEDHKAARTQQEQLEVDRLDHLAA
jgi:hypothetical protein